MNRDKRLLESVCVLREPMASTSDREEYRSQGFRSKHFRSSAMHQDDTFDRQRTDVVEREKQFGSQCPAEQTTVRSFDHRPTNLCYTPEYLSRALWHRDSVFEDIRRDTSAIVCYPLSHFHRQIHWSYNPYCTYSLSSSLNAWRDVTRTVWSTSIFSFSAHRLLILRHSVDSEFHISRCSCERDHCYRWTVGEDHRK